MAALIARTCVGIAVLAACGAPRANGSERSQDDEGLDPVERQRLQHEGESVALQAQLDRVREQMSTIEHALGETDDEPYFAALERQLAVLRVQERDLLAEVAAHAASQGADTRGDDAG